MGKDRAVEEAANDRLICVRLRLVAAKCTTPRSEYLPPRKQPEEVRASSLPASRPPLSLHQPRFRCLFPSYRLFFPKVIVTGVTFPQNSLMYSEQQEGGERFRLFCRIKLPLHLGQKSVCYKSDHVGIPLFVSLSPSAQTQNAYLFMMSLTVGGFLCLCVLLIMNPSCFGPQLLPANVSFVWNPFISVHPCCSYSMLHRTWNTPTNSWAVCTHSYLWSGCLLISEVLCGGGKVLCCNST